MHATKGRPAGSAARARCLTLVSREFPPAHPHARRAALPALPAPASPPRGPLRSARCCASTTSTRRPTTRRCRRSRAAPTSTGTHPRPGTRTPRSPRSAELCRTGRTTVPVYDIAAERRVRARRALDIERHPALRRGGHLRRGHRGALPGAGRCSPTRSVCAGRPSTTFRRRLAAGSARGPQVGAVPAAPRLAADARRARASWPARRRWAPTPATGTRPWAGWRTRRRAAAPRRARQPDRRTARRATHAVTRGAAPRTRTKSGTGQDPPALRPRSLCASPVLTPAASRRGSPGVSPVLPPLPLPRRAVLPVDPQATSSPKDSSSSRPKLRTSSSRSRRSDRQMLDFTVPTLMSRISAISGSVRPS